MAQERAGVRVNQDERRLIFAGYRAHGNNWGRVVAHLLLHADPEGPIYQIYMQRNASQQRKRVRYVLTETLYGMYFSVWGRGRGLKRVRKGVVKCIYTTIKRLQN